jgi:hypothetical protein
MSLKILSNAVHRGYSHDAKCQILTGKFRKDKKQFVL